MKILKKLLTGFGVGALVFWLLLVSMLVVMGLGSFAVPSLVPGWQAQGLKEAPLGWQILIDASDFSKSHWYILLPLFLVVAILLSIKAVRQIS